MESLWPMTTFKEARLSWTPIITFAALAMAEPVHSLSPFGETYVLSSK